MPSNPPSRGVARAPQQYRKKPVVIDAMQWDGSAESFEAIHAWAAKVNTILLSDDEEYLVVATLEDGGGKAPQAVHTADKGDWIIRGIKGEFYPCKPDIFAATYEPASSVLLPSGDARDREQLTEIRNRLFHAGHAIALHMVIELAREAKPTGDAVADTNIRNALRLAREVSDWLEPLVRVELASRGPLSGSEDTNG